MRISPWHDPTSFTLSKLHKLSYIHPRSHLLLGELIKCVLRNFKYVLLLFRELINTFSLDQLAASNNKLLTSFMSFFLRK